MPGACVMTTEQLTVLSEPCAGYHVVTLNRPDKLNSFNVQQHADLGRALDLAEADRTCRAVILTGAGRGFCAGQDLSDSSVTARPGEAPNLSDTLGLHYNPLIRRLAAFPVPVICAVNGIAAGAGANLALGCDIVIAAKSAKFLQAFAKIGLMPDAGGTWTLPRLVGPARARALAMLAEPIDAVTAESWGMIYKAVDDAALMVTARAMAEKLAQSSTAALVTIRDALARAEVNTLHQQLDVERDLQQKLASAPDYAEGVAAFFEKRTPKFRGRG
jgi:2-(1,2-epoxy-1,2-dihydrophenyl)acetyl-CoA isomerase